MVNFPKFGHKFEVANRVKSDMGENESLVLTVMFIKESGNNVSIKGQRISYREAWIAAYSYKIT